MELVLGLVLVMAGGVLEGLFSLGVTRTPQWAWENVWGLGSLVALVVIPWPLAYLVVPNLSEVLAAAEPRTIIVVFLFGIGWGVGGIFWGKAIAAVGMALGVSLLMGFVNVLGGPLPLWVFEPHRAFTMSAWALYAAVATMIFGITLIALAGKRKEADQESTPENQDIRSLSSTTPFILGLFFCMLSGVLSACVSLGLIYGNKIGHLGDITVSNGAPRWASAFVIWALVFTGNYGVNFLYALILMIKNGNLGHLFTRGGTSHWFWAFFLGLAWPIGIVLFGIGADYMGEMGAYAAFPMMLLCAVLAGNVAGVLQGEWQGASVRARNTMVLGVSILFVAFIILGYSARL